MPAVEKSIEQQIQDAVLTVLDANRAALAIDSRSVSTWRFIPEQGFSLRSLPVVVVERPELMSEDAFGAGTDRAEYRARVWLVEQARPSEEDLEAMEERLNRLRDKVHARLQAVPWLGLEELCVMPGFWELTDQRTGVRIGNSMFARELALTIPALIEGA